MPVQKVYPAGCLWQGVINGNSYPNRMYSHRPPDVRYGGRGTLDKTSWGSYTNIKGQLMTGVKNRDSWTNGAPSGDNSILPGRWTREEYTSWWLGRTTSYGFSFVRVLDRPAVGVCVCGVWVSFKSSGQLELSLFSIVLSWDSISKTTLRNVLYMFFWFICSVIFF